jgi:hypothetical protein
MLRKDGSPEKPLFERVDEVVADAKILRGWDDALLAATAETVLDDAHQLRLRTLYSSQRSPIHMFASVLSGRRIERHLETYALREEIDEANQLIETGGEVDPLNSIALLSRMVVTGWTGFSRREIGIIDNGVQLVQELIQPPVESH